MASVSPKTNGRPPLQDDTHNFYKGGVWMTGDFPASEGWR